KASRRGVRAMALSLLSGMIMMANPVTAANLPTGGQIVAGSGSIQTPSGNQMNIHQNSQNMVANWNSFDIGKGNTVQFYQPNSSAVALNRVVGGGESKIMGNLKANGQVFLVNPNGVLFGKDASVSTSGFVASTRDIKNDDFMNRRYTFSGGQKAGAEIVNQGALTTNAGGYIVLAADKVSNSGTIRTPGGKTVLAAGERVTLQLDNGGLTSVQVSGDVVNALVENRGLISARNGQVYLTALGRDMLMNTVLNVSGVVEASGMHRQDGNIVLDGGDSGVVHLSGTLQADNASGQGGKVVVQGQNILLDKGSSITATGGQGGGEVYIGGGWQGKDSSIRNADKVVMKDGARIDVSATQQGNGGTAVLWSESFTNFRGQVSAKGGENGGNGGQVETSSHGNLQAFGSVSASAKKGKAGNWLLDPLDITIVNGADNAVTETNDTLSQPPHTQFTPTATGSQVSNTSINDELNNGTSVTVLTSSTTAGGNQNGNITVDADINKTNGTDATLTLKADGNINVNNNITSTNGKLNVNLAAANTSSTATITLGNNVNITTNGGDITAGTANASNSVTINVTGTTLNTSNGSQAGNINLNGSRVNVTNANITAGNFTLNATANGSNLNNVTLMATHDIILTGSNTTGVGLQLNGTNTLNATNGSISLTGNSTNGIGIDLEGTNILTATGGAISFNGTSGRNRGINICGTSNMTATAINLTGSSTGAEGIDISGSSTLTATSGNISLNGTAQSQWYGVRIQGSNITATNGSISLTGNSTNGTGLQLNGSTTLNATNGSINLTGNSTNGTGIDLQGTNTLTATSGAISFNGTSGSKNRGINIYGTSNILNATEINLTGSSTGAEGIDISGNSTLTATSGNISLNGTAQSNWYGVRIQGSNITATNGSISLAGSNTNGTGLQLNGTNTLTATNGSINLTGNSTNGTGLHLRDTNTLTASNGSVNINGSAESNASAVDISGNSTVHAINGNININGTVNKLFTDYPEKAGVRLNNVILNASSGTVNINGSVNSEKEAPLSAAYKAGVILGPNVNISALDSYINGTISGEYGFGVAFGGKDYSNTEINISGNASINGSSSGNNIFSAGVAFGFSETILNVNNGTLNINGTSGGYGIATKPSNGQWASTSVTINLTNSNVAMSGCGSIAGVFLARHDTAPHSASGVTMVLNGGTGNISGHSDTGVGVVLGGSTNINGVTVNGTSNTGTGVIINGEANVINASVNGNSNGTGVSITGAVNITGSTVTGNATGNGNGVNISGNITDGVISGSATGNGSGVGISGDSTLNNTTVSGNGTDGAGVSISG
ncbi:TPA: filamentous hemagglutinin N-terminal domain-containing protein, partial [Escherichia coli]|nr:filamentous hemagglutinin N-terminal domain-containing protein [Escherichia coli]HDQ0394123.1 filamentous hemagglutinin N-terminal domain-containing protein [Escherichia coli]